MNEDDKKKLEAEVFGTDEVPKEFEIQYLESAKDVYTRELRSILVNFRIYSYTNDDDRMAACKKDIKKVRDSLAFAEKRLGELRG